MKIYLFAAGLLCLAAVSVRANDDNPVIVPAPVVNNNIGVGLNPVVSNNTAVAPSVTVNNPAPPRQAPELFVPQPAAGTCRSGGSAGGTSPFGGLVLSLSRSDKECEKRLAARSFWEIGDTQAAHDLLCQLKVAKNISACLPSAVVAPSPTLSGAAPLSDADSNSTIILKYGGITCCDFTDQGFCKPVACK